MMIRVGVFGAGGRMGSTVCGAVSGDPELELVGAVDPYHAGLDLQQLGVDGAGVQVARSASALKDAGAEVAVDFTVVEAARANLEWCADNGVHAVVGTTGFTDADLDHFARRFRASSANCVIAPNFAIGAVLMMRFAELAAPYFETAEVIELHHDEKVDAPSGTAMLTLARMAAASESWGPDPTEKHPRALGPTAGTRGPPGGAPRHDRAVAGDPPRLVRPLVVHAGRAPRGPRGSGEARADHRAGRAARSVTGPAMLERGASPSPGPPVPAG
jgi:4-hydroxy-tetrahydrodipicolinate reductase